MSGYLLVMAMLIVALIAVLLAFLLDHDDVESSFDQVERDARESGSADVADPAAPIVENEGTNRNGSASI